MIKFISLGVSFLLLNCALVGEDTDFIYSPTGPDSIKVESMSGGFIQFTAFCTVGDPCWIFSSLEQTRDVDTVWIKILSKRDRKAVCIAVLSPLKVPISVNVGSPGVYRFVFWRSETSTLDTTFAVN